MTGLDVFTFVVMFVLLTAVAILIKLLGALPGNIAAVAAIPRLMSLTCVGGWHFNPWAATAGYRTARRQRHMIAFITLIYCGLIWLLFFKLKVLPFNAAAKVIVSVVGVAGILALLIFMSMYQPYSKDLTVYQDIVQVAPEVGGRVIEVPVKALAPVKRGDMLFKIDPRPYQYQIDKLKACLAEARSDLELTTLELERATDILKKGAGSSRDVNTWRVQLAAAEGAVGKLQAGAEHHRDDIRVRLTVVDEINEQYGLKEKQD